jgi:hypothetical protein
MTNAVRIPEDTDLLCEGCGYVLNGLPADSKCPECGKPAAESAPLHRQLPSWEKPAEASRLKRFLQTTGAVLFRPTEFYRTLVTRQPRLSSQRFAAIHWGVVSLLFAIAAYVHFKWYLMMGNLPPALLAFDHAVPAVVLLWGITGLLLIVTTRLAAKLTSWEAGYRGLRLPMAVVLRGLDYHAAHYLPVAIAGAGTVIGYRILLDRHLVSGYSGPFYLYVLCGEVLVAAAYLFWTYWIGMKNMMYANA